MLGFLYSVVAYVAFFASFTALALFTNGLLLPKTVDTGEPGGLGLALAVNIGLLLAWGVQHSAMARQGFKDWLVRFVPTHLERATYVLASAIALTALLVFWQPMAGVLWQVEAPAAVVSLWVLNALGWFGVPVASFLIDHFDLFGLKQAFMQWRHKSFERKGFVMPWLYRYVRHPMMTALMVGLWAAPTMTVSHFALSLGLTVYVVIGVYFEERSLRRELGADYVTYQASTPKFLPRLAGRGSQGAVPIPVAGSEA